MVRNRVHDEAAAGSDGAASGEAQDVPSPPRSDAGVDKPLMPSQEGATQGASQVSGAQGSGVVQTGALALAQQPGLASRALAVGVLLVMGFLFGTALNKSLVFDPYIIRAQMFLTRWVMMKTFLAAVASGSLVLAVAVTASKHFAAIFNAAVEEYTGCLTRGLPSVVLGAMLLGAGMTLSGACPGMVLAQVGALVENSYYTLLGCLVAALVYGLLHPFISACVLPIGTAATANMPNYFHELIGASRLATMIAVGLAMAVVVVLLEVFLPWTNDAPACTSSNVWSCVAWPPYVGGILIGCLQVPAVLSVGDTLGSSTSYAQITAPTAYLVPKYQERLEYMSSRLGLDDWLTKWWQVIYVGAAVMGSYVSALASGSVGAAQGVPVQAAFAGGFVMVFGARLAGGCTSGHGISGTAMLAIASFIAIPSMFAGGIAAAYAMHAAGVLNVGSQMF